MAEDLLTANGLTLKTDIELKESVYGKFSALFVVSRDLSDIVRYRRDGATLATTCLAPAFKYKLE